MLLPLIQTRNLSKAYQLDHLKVEALKNINLEINEGEFVSIMGPSGSGKSTLMHLLGCLDTPTAGEYFLEGQKIDKSANLAKIRREKIGFVFQFFNLIPRLSALKNVELPMVYQGVSSTKRRNWARELLESVGLGDRVNHTPSQLSGGQRQKVAIARALANHPRLVLADEPTGNLDSHSGEEILQILQNLNQQQGVTLIIVTHENFIAQRAQRIILMQDGQLLDSP